MTLSDLLEQPCDKSDNAISPSSLLQVINSLIQTQGRATWGAGGVTPPKKVKKGGPTCGEGALGWNCKICKNEGFVR